MFNVGGPELLVIALVALIVLGPDKLPGFIRQAGQILGELRRISSSFQADVRGALEAAEREADEELDADTAGTPDALDRPEPDPETARAVAQAELDELMASEASDGPPDTDGRHTSSDQTSDESSGPSSDTSSAA